MGLYKNILVPVVLDHQEKAEHALEVANSLKADGGSLTLLHVIEQIPTYIASQLTQDIWKDTMAGAKEKLEKLADSFDPNVKCHVVEGHANRSIMDHAEKMKADCIVIASHQPGLEDYLIGSTASRVVRHAKCPVHILR